MCFANRLANERISETQMCSNAWERQQFGADVNNICAKAEADLQITPFGCAVRLFWRTGLVYKLYLLIVVEHTWVIFVIMTLCLLYIIQQTFSSWNQSRSEAQSERLYNASLETFNKLHQRQTPQLQSSKKAPLLRGRSYVQLARDYPN